MALISFSDVDRFYGPQNVLNGATWAIGPRERVGLVGHNGAGKTTLIRLITGQESPDAGQITWSRGLRLGYLPQEIMAQKGKSLLELVMDIAEEFRQTEEELAFINAAMEAATDQEELTQLAERQSHLMHLFESLGGWQKEAEAKKILSGLGFTEKDFGRDLSEFSGGWIMRGLLARLLLSSPDLLVLDEPTNHLDLDSLIWLEGYLKGSDSALLLVSHDRVFLNNVVQKIVELRQGKTHTYVGDYEHFIVEREQRLATATAAFVNQQEQIKQIEKFIERNRVRASTARRAQSRMKQLEKMDKLEAPESVSDRSFHFYLPKPERGPNQVLELAGVSKSYGALPIFTDLNLQLRRGERLALVGPNGRGKSTLLKMLAGLEPLSGGVYRLGTGIRLGYFAQFQLERLNPKNTILEELATVAGDMTQSALRSVLGSFLFSGEDVFKKVTVLSGGEKARVTLAKIMLTAPNFLLLDEPTNHLDLPGRQMLEEALRAYEGTMVLISHDRHFLNNLAHSIGVISGGRLDVYPGNFDDYARLWQAGENLGSQKNPSPLSQEKEGAAAKASKKESRQKEAQARRELAASRRPWQKIVTQCEERLAEIELAKAELENTLADPATYQDGERVKKLQQELKALAQETATLELKWEEAVTVLEGLEE